MSGATLSSHAMRLRIPKCWTFFASLSSLTASLMSQLSECKACTPYHDLSAKGECACSLICAGKLVRNSLFFKCFRLYMDTIRLLDDKEYFRCLRRCAAIEKRHQQ